MSRFVLSSRRALRGRTAAAGGGGGGGGNHSLYTNLPGADAAGITVLSDTAFDALNGWTLTNNNNNSGTNGVVQLATDATDPVDPSGVLEFTLPTGFNGGFSPGTAYPPGGTGMSVRRFVWGYHWRVNSGWQRNPDLDKHGFWWTTDAANAANRGIPYFCSHASSTANYRQGSLLFNTAAQLGVGGPTLCPQDGTNGNIGDFHAPTCGFASTIDLHDGSWHKVEVDFRFRSAAGVADGWLRTWVDGVQQHDLSTSIQWYALFNESYFDTYWGGTIGTKTQDDYCHAAHAYLATLAA